MKKEKIAYKIEWYKLNRIVKYRDRDKTFHKNNQSSERVKEIKEKKENGGSHERRDRR